MSTCSIVMIVKNAAAHLEDVLQSVKWADEIIILDSGSSDATLDIAKQYTTHIYTHTNWEGFGKQRQLADSYATKDWILSLDADEVLSDALYQDIQRVIQLNNQSCVYRMSRLSTIFGKEIRHGGWYPDHVTRLYPRLKATYSNDLVHESLTYPNTLTCEKLQGDLLHTPYENLQHYLIKSAQYAQASGLARFKKGKRASLCSAIGHGVWCFIRMYFLRAGFLDGRQGLLLALLSGHSVFSKYASLYVMQLSEKQ